MVQFGWSFERKNPAKSEKWKNTLHSHIWNLWISNFLYIEQISRSLGGYCSKKKHSCLSASSSTRISMVCRSKEGVLCKWSIKRPGVAMIMSGFFRRSASCVLKSSPPLIWIKKNLFKIYIPYLFYMSHDKLYHDLSTGLV